MKFFAASIPRSVRAARLNYLKPESIIGFWFTEQKGGGNLIFDVIMLPEDQFLRARNYLSSAAGSPALQQGSVTPPYIPRDVKEITVPGDVENPSQFALAYFRNEFGLQKDKPPLS